MRLRIVLEDELVAEIDRRVGSRGRSAFIGQVIRRGLEDERRWKDIEAALGTISIRGTIGTMIRRRGCAASAVATRAGRADR